MSSRRLRQYRLNDLASLCGAVVVILFWRAPSTAILGATSENRAESRTMGPIAIEKNGEDSQYQRFATGDNLLALDDNRRGTLRERIRERRESRANERLRQDDNFAAQDSDSRSAGRRINVERVQSWIAQLRDRIREEVGGIAENRLFQTDPGLERMPPLGRPDLTGPAPGFVRPLPQPNVWPSEPAVPPAQDGWQASNPGDIVASGPELVAPEPSPTEASKGRAENVIPPTGGSQVAEVPQAGAGGNDSSQARGAQVTPPVTDQGDSPQAQQSSKPSGLGGLFSNVTKMFGATGSNNQEAGNSSGESKNSTPPSPAQPEANAATRSESKSPTSIRKTLSEIRKQILLKQSQGQAPVGN